jgi:hypothetical protein
LGVRELEVVSDGLLVKQIKAVSSEDEASELWEELTDLESRFSRVRYTAVRAPITADRP